MKLLSFVFVLLLAACGGKDEATPEQLAKVKSVNKSVNDVQSAGFSARQNGRTRQLYRTLDKNRTNEFDSDYSSSRLRTEMSNDIEKCQFDGGGSASQASFKIDGDDCPFVMDIHMSLKSQTRAELRMYFELRSEELKKLSDVTKLDLSGPITQEGGSLNGSLLSKKHGSVGIKFNVQRSATNTGAIEITYEFSDFSVDIKLESDGKELKCQVNGHDKSPEETFELVQGLFPGMSTSGASLNTVAHLVR